MALSDNLRKSFGAAFQAVRGPSMAALQQQDMTSSTLLGPGSPIIPADGISEMPRAFDFPTGYNIAARPRSQERMSFKSMKGLIDNYDIAQLAISHRIDSLRAVDWSVVPMDEAQGDLSREIAYARAFLRKPDGKLFFRNWVSKFARGILAYDAGTLYRMRNNAGRCIGLKVVDGTTIAPLIDGHGDQPTGDAPAYLQIVSGTVWNWLLDDDIIYQPFRPRDDSPYGQPPIEAVILGANTDLRMQAYFLSKYTKGNIPEGFAISPDQWTADQIEQWQTVWDAQFLGNQDVKSQMRWLPGGTKLEFPNLQDWDTGNQAAAEWGMRKTASAFHITPDALGFAMDSNRSVGETQADVDDRMGDLPLGQHIADIITDVLQVDLGLPVKFQFDFAGTEEGIYATAQADGIYIDKGVVSVSKIAEMRFGITDVEQIPRFVFTTTNGPVPLASLVASSTPVDPETAAPDPGSIPVSEIAPPLPIVSIGAKVGITAEEPGLRLPGETPVQALPAAAPIAKSEGKPEMVAFAKFVKSRRRLGTWSRDFAFTTVDAATGHQLNQQARAEIRKEAGELIAAGLAVVAADTGRVLLLQRAVTPGDQPGGHWEFPGGCIEAGESPLDAAIREWREETGLTVSIGQQTNDWLSPNGVYAGYVFTVESEFSIMERADGVNPDDPDGDEVEALAWWNPHLMVNNPAIRPELSADMSIVLGALAGFAVRPIPPVDNPVEGDAVPLVKGWRDNSTSQPQSDYDLQLVDHYSPLIQAALTKWVEGLPIESAVSGFIAKADTPNAELVRQAIASALGRVPTPPELEQILAELYADGWMAGEHASELQLSPHVVSVAGLSPATIDVDWSNWVAGDPAAASAIRAGGLNDLLDQAGITIKGMTDSAITQIGNMLADGLDAGNSIDKMGRSIRDAIGSKARADRIAHTESTRAVLSATMGVYGSNGVGQWDTIVTPGADAGSNSTPCLDSEAANPHTVGGGDRFPPFHPYCRCATAPVVSSISADNIQTIDADTLEGDE